NGEEIGYVGQVHPTVQKELDLKDTYVFEIKAEPMFTFEKQALKYDPIAKFPSITRDIALVVDKDITAGELETVIRSAGGRLLHEVHVFDLYEGDKMEAGKKSIAFSLTYQDKEKTLTDEEVINANEKVLTAVKEQCKAELRG